MWGQQCRSDLHVNQKPRCRLLLLCNYNTVCAHTQNLIYIYILIINSHQSFEASSLIIWRTCLVNFPDDLSTTFCTNMGGAPWSQWVRVNSIWKKYPPTTISSSTSTSFSLPHTPPLSPLSLPLTSHGLLCHTPNPPAAAGANSWDHLSSNLLFIGRNMWSLAHPPRGVCGVEYHILT